jgi:acetoacetate decarboxylase
MASQGRLSLKNLGYSMPADAPAYQRPPYYYRDTRSIAVTFETDADAALQALPEPLTLSDPPTAVLSFYDYRWSTFGPYNEAILSLFVEHKGRPLNYIMHIAVTTEPPMLGGREIWGYPKKLAAISLSTERDMIFGTLERPAGIRLASAVVRPERPIANASGWAGRPALSFRLIPSPERDAERPTCAELIEAEIDQKIIEAWEGTGSVSFPDSTTLDPWNRLPVKRVLSASYLVYDMTLGFGKVIDRLR